MKIQLTQQIIISNKSNKFAQLDELCFLSKNLYNVALLLPNSKTYKNLNSNTKYFGMYNSETKVSTVWVGLAESITKMYNNLKKDRTLKLTELF